MKNVIPFLGLLLIGFWYLSFSAGRLDRLHHRVETSWATLDSLLQRRAAIALEVSRSAVTDPATSLLLTASAYQARSADIEDRSSAESVLSGALGMMLAEREIIVAKSDQALLLELEQLTDKIKIAISKVLPIGNTAAEALSSAIVCAGILNTKSASCAGLLVGCAVK